MNTPLITQLDKIVILTFPSQLYEHTINNSIVYQKEWVKTFNPFTFHSLFTALIQLLAILTNL